MARHLHSMGLTRDGEMHSYHCDCDGCDFGSGYPFRVQRDSTCSGEVISSVFSTGALMQEALGAMTALERAALDADAEPGHNAGFHVHVGMRRRSDESRANILWAFLRWEPVLAAIASGRFLQQRTGMNNTVSSCLHYSFAAAKASAGAPWYANVNAYRHVDYDWYAEKLSEPAIRELRLNALAWHGDSDRHSNLNINTRRATWEFRLWNSTRSAWRMELFCGLSVALVSDNVVDRLLTADVDAETLPAILAAAEHQRTAELLERQLHYINTVAPTAPAILTCL